MSTRIIEARYGLIGNDLELVENVRIHLADDNSIIEIEELSWEVLESTVFVPGLFNAHVHSGDIGLRGIEVKDLATMVGPGGIKHRHLNEMTDEDLRLAVNKSYQEAKISGALGWADFREGGLWGLGPYPLGRAYLPFARPAISELGDLPSYANIGIRDVVQHTPEEFAEMAKFQQSFSGKTFIHVSEDLDLRNRWIREYGESDLVWIGKALDIDAFIHATHIDNSDIDFIKTNNSSVVLNISSNKITKVGVPPILEIVDNDISWGIGTDNAMFSSLSIWQEFDHFKQFSIDAKALFYAGTIGGARIAGLEWGIEKGNSNFLKLRIPESEPVTSEKDLFEFLVTNMHEQYIVEMIT